jgi:hypothetical protein
MGVHSERPRAQSLGAWLSGLRPGDACPWCGARLQAGGRAARAVGQGASASEPSGPRATLVCSDCGCEVCAVDGTTEAGGTLLGHAA